jgi:hypothetical protein
MALLAVSPSVNKRSLKQAISKTFKAFSKPRVLAYSQGIAEHVLLFNAFVRYPHSFLTNSGSFLGDVGQQSF